MRALSRAILARPSGPIVLRNLLTRTQDFTDLNVWPNANGPVTRTANGTVAPDGSQSADSLSASPSAQVEQRVHPARGTAGFAFTFSVYLRADAPCSVDLKNTQGAIADHFQTVNLTTSWVRYSYTINNTTDAGNGDQIVGLTNIQSNPSPGTIYAWGAQLEYGGSASSYQPVA